MNLSFDKLKFFFEEVKTMTFWQRIFRWRSFKVMGYDAYLEFRSISEIINKLDKQVLDRDSKIFGLENNIGILTARLNDLSFSNQKLENKLSMLESELRRSAAERSELGNELARYRQAEQSRIEDYMKNVAGVNVLQAGLEKERNKLTDDRIREKEEAYEKRKQTWRNHQDAVEAAIRSICQTHFIEYVKEVPFRGNPDNAIMIAGEYIIFDAKSPAGDDLENFPKYLRAQTESMGKYIKQENVKSDIFLVVPSNTLESLKQFSYNMGDYNTYIVSIDALEPVILSLRKLEDYEFAGQMTPEERENICRIIGKFAHTAKRKIQIDYFFSYQFLEILSKCNVGLPDDILRSVEEFEKAEKLNPPQEKRARQILTDDLVREGERLAVEARAKLMGKEED